VIQSWFKRIVWLCVSADLTEAQLANPTIPFVNDQWVHRLYGVDLDNLLTVSILNPFGLPESCLTALTAIVLCGNLQCHAAIATQSRFLGNVFGSCPVGLILSLAPKGAECRPGNRGLEQFLTNSTFDPLLRVPCVAASLNRNDILSPCEVIETTLT
jgi:hypothetical protein